MNLFGAAKPFGTTQNAVTSAPVFGFGTSTVPSTSGFGGFSFGTQPTTSQSTGFFQQSAAAKPASNPFGGIFTSTAPFQTFGGASSIQSTAPSLFAPSLSGSTGFQVAQSQPPAFSFKLPQQPAATFLPNQTGQTNQIAPQTSTLPQSSVDAFFASLCQPMLFGDERDMVLARWNQLQAMWGTGIGYSALGPAVFTPDNTFARLKAIAYNVLPTGSDSDGAVCLYLSQPFAQVKAQQQAVQDTLFRLLGGRPNVQLVLEEIRPCGEQSNLTEVIIKVLERQSTGNVTSVASSELVKYLSSPTVAPQLQSQLSVCHLNAEVCPSAHQLTLYRENPPAGIDRLIWEQAYLENPHPSRTIPVPLIGLADLRRRRQDQMAFSRQQSAILKHINSFTEEMKTAQLMLNQKIVQLKQKQILLSHRILEVLRRQELYRRSGFAISGEEEALRCGLERIWSELTSPQQGLRQRFQDALASLHVSPLSTADSTGIKPSGVGGDSLEAAVGEQHPTTAMVTWNLDVDAWAELKEYLSQRQTGIREMQHTLTELSATLKVMEEKKPTTGTGNRLASVSKVSFAVNARAC